MRTPASRCLRGAAGALAATLVTSACGSDFLLGYESDPTPAGATSSSAASSSGVGSYSEASGSGTVYGSGASSSSASSSSSAASSSTGSSGAASSGSAGPGCGGAVTGVTGGQLEQLNFAIVGGNAPATDLVAHIWLELGTSPNLPAFAVTTGNYGAGQTQLEQYLGAQQVFANLAFPTMGAQECTGSLASNCGVGNRNGIATEYAVFLKDMLAPLGVTLPYYTVAVASPHGTWTAKLVFVAANAWDAAQASWLDTELGKPTTYTFVMRSEPSCSTAPGVGPSDAILAQHPYTVLLAGRDLPCDTGARQMVVAPPAPSGASCAYMIVQQRHDRAVVFTQRDCATGALQTTVALNPDGSPV